MDTAADRQSPKQNTKVLGPALAEDFNKIADFMNDDPDRVIFRRFPRLNLYNLLFLQHRLNCINHDADMYARGGEFEKLVEVLPSLSGVLESYSR